MQFLKILFWCLLAFVAAVFTIGNWTTVDIRLWGGLIAQVNLPLLLLLTFLLGLVPAMLYYGTIRWRLRNRLTATERAISDLRATAVPVDAPQSPGFEPVAAAPTSVQPAVPPVNVTPVNVAPADATTSATRKGGTAPSLFPDAS